MLTLTLDPEDRHTGLTPTVFAGALAAIILALFRLPPVALHGPQHRLGIMDPLCGMTRATRFLVRGNFARAWRYNPASFALAAGAATLVARFAFGTATDRWWNVRVQSRLAVFAVLAPGVALLWLSQQLHAPLLS